MIPFKIYIFNNIISGFYFSLVSVHILIDFMKTFYKASEFLNSILEKTSK